MKEAAMMAEQEVKEEKLRAEVIRPAMAALLAGKVEEGDKVACDWICADAVKRMEVGAGGSEVDGKTAVQAAVAAWRQRLALQAAVTETSYQGQTEQSVWDTKANQSGVVSGVLAFDPNPYLDTEKDVETSPPNPYLKAEDYTLNYKQTQLDKMEEKIAEFEMVLERMSGMVGKAGDAISTANTVIEIVGDAVPVFGGAFHALNKVLIAVQRANELADEVVEVGRSAVDYLKLLIKVGRKALPLDMKVEAKREVNDAIVEVVSLLEELSEAVGEFGKPGFVRRMWRAGTKAKAAKTLKSLDGKIRRKFEEIVNLYGLAQMDGIEAMLTELLKERTFPTEDKIASVAEEMVKARMEEMGETDEEARAALEKDEAANTKLESVF
jgi:hypothetical protein